MTVRNWQHVNRRLVNSGSISLWIEDLPKDHWVMKGPRGRPKFHPKIIEAGLILKTVFNLPYRALQGFLGSILNCMGLSLKTPNYTLFCKRKKEVLKTLPKLSKRRPAAILLDASGLKVMGEGEWKVKIHKQSRRRKWIKAHIGVDPNSQEIVALEVTNSNVGDSNMLPNLVESSPKTVKTVIADGAYDSRSIRDYLFEKGISTLIPPQINGRLWEGEAYAQRNDAIRIIKGLGGDAEAKSLWRKLSGYSIRNLVETAFFRMKKLFGERLNARSFMGQKIEVLLRCFVLNRMISVSCDK